MVFVLDDNREPLRPCSPKRARLLLERGRATVFRLRPFTIIIGDWLAGSSSFQPLTLKLDPGSKTTGAAIVREIPSGEGEGSRVEIVQLLEIWRRGQTIRKKLEQRRNYRRRRRSKNLRYRQPRFLNRGNKGKGWLPPSIRRRVDSTVNVARKLATLAPITGLAVETVRFDAQRLQNPEITGVEYQQGELFGYEVREYLLEKFGRSCAYCEAEKVPFQVEHVVPKAKGGSNRISNLTLACERRNWEKGDRDLEDYLAKRPELAKSVKVRAKAPLRDVAAVNSTRWALWNALKSFGLPMAMGSGGRTKFNRTRLGIPKSHALDAACVGEVSAVTGWRRNVLTIRRMGRGSHQRTRVDAYGFPRGHLSRSKSVFGFRTGDLVRANVPKGKFRGVWTGRVAVRATGSFDIKTVEGKKTVNNKRCTLLRLNDGYEYGFGPGYLEPNSSLG